MIGQMALGLFVALVTGAAVHEAGHYLAMRACGKRPRRWHFGAGRVLCRRGRWVIHAWPVGVAMQTGRHKFYRWSLWRRLVNHLAGPAANGLAGLLFLGLWRAFSAGWLLWAALGQLVLTATNLLPLPFFDGGWVVTACVNAALNRGRMRLPREARWHVAALPYGIVVAVAGLGAGLWYGLLR